MANTLTTLTDATGYVYGTEASVDTDPGASGYGCSAVSLRRTVGLTATQKVFYIKSIGTSAIVTLQWKREADLTWTDYADYTAVCRNAIADPSQNMYWRAIVKDNNQGSSGASVFGIDW